MSLDVRFGGWNVSVHAKMIHRFDPTLPTAAIVPQSFAAGKHSRDLLFRYDSVVWL